MAEIVRLGPEDVARVVAAAECFDEPPRPEATARFLASPDHHLLLAYADDTAVGMVTGVELTHPDKGTEMFLYELGVVPAHQRRGVGRTLVDALATLAAERGCYGMWVLVDDGNEAALRTYASAGGVPDSRPHAIGWRFGA